MDLIGGELGHVHPFTLSELGHGLEGKQGRKRALNRIGIAVDNRQCGVPRVIRINQIRRGIKYNRRRLIADGKGLDHGVGGAIDH